MPLDPQKLQMLLGALGGGGGGPPGGLPGMPQGALAPGQTGMPPLPTPAPAPSPQVPLGPDQVGSSNPMDPSKSDMSAPGQNGPPTSPLGLLPQRQGDMFNPPFTGAEPTVEPNGSSPPVNNVGRNPLGALLLPPTIMQMLQRIGK